MINLIYDKKNHFNWHFDCKLQIYNKKIFSAKNICFFANIQHARLYKKCNQFNTKTDIKRY